MITASSDSCNPPCIIPSSCMWTGPNDSLLTNIIQQKLWESLLKLGCKKTTAFILHVLSCSLLLICCDEIWLRCAEAHLARNWGRLWLNTSEEPRPSVQQTMWNWILPTTTWVSSVEDPLSFEVSNETTTLDNTFSTA